MSKTKKILKGSLVVTLSLLFFFSSYSVNFFAKANDRKETINDLSEEKNIVIITDNETSTEETVNTVVEENIDPEFKDIQDKVDNTELNVSVVSPENKRDLEKSSTIAADVAVVEGNDLYKDFLKAELEGGKRVFLYGDVQAEEYKEIFELDELAVKENNGQLEFGLSEEELNKKAIENGKEVVDEKLTDDEGNEKGSLDAAESKYTSHVIGYTIDNNQKLQYVDVSINNFDENGNSIPNTKGMVLQEVLNTQTEIIDSENEPNQENNTTAASTFITTNKVQAANVRVKNKYNIVEKGYRLGLLVARMDTDWHLYKQNSEKSKKYDYFTLKPITQVTSYKGLWARSIYTDIDIPADTDHLDDWGPMGDQGTSSVSMSLGYPFSVGISMDFGENLQIDDRSSLAYDYARWQLNDGAMDLNRNISGKTFNPAAG
ncbi:hypothetical protein [Peribacillus sp. SI8-4]|uniref:hypothetical protein n=1 Tax=Peribacillus sp. SI8-4 TaxID=3048009 RepID=UPI002553E0B6|nr:hypothetical protein [Peribacillus sp. SI8-4]